MRYNIIVIEVHQTEIFVGWFAKLKDKRARAHILTRIDRASIGNFGKCKSIGEGVSEMRICHGPGYRVYFVERGKELIILLAGGDKSRQSKDIKTALEIARNL